MTDKEIIKALECCVANDNKCPNCPIFESEICGKPSLFYKEVLDLINRQQVEIKRLNELLVDTEKSFNKMTELYNKTFKRYQTAKADAIKEFADRLKALDRLDVDVSYGYGREHYTEAIAVNLIDNLIKEMVGEE